MRWKLAHPWLGSNPRSLDYIPISITRHVSDHQSKASQIYFYISGSPNKEIVQKMTKNMNWICPMTAILNFTICGKTVSFTAWHTAEMDSQNFHIETTNEVLFLKNAYRSLFGAIFQFFVLTSKRYYLDIIFHCVKFGSIQLQYFCLNHSKFAHFVTQTLIQTFQLFLWHSLTPGRIHNLGHLTICNIPLMILYVLPLRTSWWANNRLVGVFRRPDAHAMSL